MNKIETYKSSDNKKIFMIFGMVFILFWAMLLSLKIGSIEITFKELVEGILLNVESDSFLIIKDLRLPRVLAAVIIGGNLAVSGALLQTIMKNPLADPIGSL